MPTDCEAEERILRAVFAIEQMTGNWIIDLAKLKQILTGTDCHADCKRCQCDFDGPVLWHAREIKARND